MDYAAHHVNVQLILLQWWELMLVLGLLVLLVLLLHEPLAQGFDFCMGVSKQPPHLRN
jgi:hypothetical protein